MAALKITGQSAEPTVTSSDAGMVYYDSDTNKLRFYNGSAWADVSSTQPEIVVYRASGTSTPSGWSEYTSARGRMIVGLPDGGADGGTVGTAFTTAQDKSKSIAHTHTGPSHAHKVSTNGYNDAAAGEGLEYRYGNVFGTYSGTFGMNEFTRDQYNASLAHGCDLTDVEGTGVTGAMSANAAVVTSDVLAYIQLMLIKKD